MHDNFYMCIRILNPVDKLSKFKVLQILKDTVLEIMLYTVQKLSPIKKP